MLPIHQYGCLVVVGADLPILIYNPGVWLAIESEFPTLTLPHQTPLPHQGTGLVIYIDWDRKTLGTDSW